MEVWSALESAPEGLRFESLELGLSKPPRRDGGQAETDVDTGLGTHRGWGR